MKSVVFNSEALTYAIEEVPTPQAGPGEVVVRLKAAALNRRDHHILNIETNRSRLRNFIMGSDGAGIVAEVGEGVSDWRPGDEVLISPAIVCNTCPSCLAGMFCDNFVTLGWSSPERKFNGTFAEYIKMPAQYLYRKPAHLDFHQAAALPLAFGTAWRILMSRAQLKPGETVLIHGVGGGVALYAMQIASKIGARTIVTSGSDEKLQRAQEMGADVTINYRTEDVISRVKEATNGLGAEVIVDGVGKDTLQLSLDAARHEGRIVFFGNNKEWDGERTMIYPSPVWGKQLSFLGSAMFGPGEFAAALRFIEQTKLVPSVSEVIPLEEIQQAFDKLKHHQQFGKLVLAIS